jgi:hypothetical protein
MNIFSVARIDIYSNGKERITKNKRNKEQKNKGQF